MYLEHFGLTVSPFGISPRLDFLYKSGAFEESMAHLVYGLDSSEAIVMITGAIGTGKTMAVQSFLSHLGDRYISALVTNTSVDGRELLKLVLDDLGAPLEPASDKSDLLIAFKKFLIEAGRDGRRIIIVIDEAQNLSREVLEEIRQLTNLGQGAEQPVQVVLVGQPELEASVARPDLAQLRQRIRVHYKLAPLTRREVEEYVDHRMAVAGGSRGVFSGKALDRIYELSGGVPRVVNTLCSDGLLSAFVAGRRKVEAVDVGDGNGAERSPEPREEPAAPRSPMPAKAPAAATAPPAASQAPSPAPAAPAPAPAQQRREPVAAERGPDMATRRGRGSRTSSSRGRRRGAGLWVALALVVVAVAALAVTGRIAIPGLVPRDEPGAGQAARQAEPARSGPAASVAAQQAPAVPAANDSIAPADSARAGAAEAAPGGDLARADVPVEPASRPVNESSPAATQPAAAPAERPASTPPVEAAPASAQEDVAPDGEHYIHVSSFRTAPHAGAVAAKFTESGLLAVVREQTVRDVLWYRVYLGPFGSHDDAVRVANRLRDEGTITYYKVIRAGAGEGL